MNFGTFLYKKLFTKNAFRENRHSDTRTLLGRRKCVYVHTFSMSWPIRVKIGIGDLDVLLLRIHEFREIRWSESPILHLITAVTLARIFCSSSDSKKKNRYRYSDGEFRENPRNKSHTFLSGLNKFLLVLFIFILRLGWNPAQRST